MALTLAQYLVRTQRLLQNPSAPTSLYPTDALTEWINQGRVQVAGESEAIRQLGTIDTVPGSRVYQIDDINTGVSATNGIAGALKVNAIMFSVGEGYKWIGPRAWQWFQTFYMAKVVPSEGEPTDWAQYGQGSTGNFYLDPIPQQVYTLTCDCVCYPIDLEDDNDVDAIPKLWDDAVPYYAAYLALLAAQSQQRSADANMMMERYSFFVERARKFSNPMPSGYLYSQATDPTRQNKLAGAGGIPRGGG